MTNYTLICFLIIVINFYVKIKHSINILKVQNEFFYNFIYFIESGFSTIGRTHS